MLDKKDLRGAAVLFRDLAQLLTEWADDLDRKKNGRKAAEGPAEVPAVAAEPAAVPASDGRPVPPYTPDAVLVYLGTKIARGFRPQVQALLNSYGARKFSEVDPAYYGDLVEAVAGLGADPGGDGHA